MFPTPNGNGYTGWRGGPPKDIDWAHVQRPEHKRNPPVGPVFRPPPILLRPQKADWQLRPDLAIRIRNLHKTTTTYDLHQAFKKHGEIVRIEIFHDQAGVIEGVARVRFSPPPAKAFWSTVCHTVKSQNLNQEYVVHISVEESRRKNFRIQSPIRKTIFYDPKMKMYVSALYFGLMVAPQSFMRMHLAGPLPADNSLGNQNDVTFVVDLYRRRIEANFKIMFTDPRSEGSTDDVSTASVGFYSRINSFKFWIPFEQLQKIQRFNLDDGGFALVISRDSPPQFFRKGEDERTGHSDESAVWTEFDTWYRQTDIVYDPHRLQEDVVTLHKERPVIDIGKSLVSIADVVLLT
jgi:RNA-dependent RNA polymerase